ELQVIVFDCPGEQALARLVLAGHEDAAIEAGALFAFGAHRGAQPRRLLAILLRAALECLRGGNPLRRRQVRSIERLRIDALKRVGALDAKCAAESRDGASDVAILRDPGVDQLAVSD